MAKVYFDYTNPQSSPYQMEGLIVDSFVMINIDASMATGKFFPTMYDGVNLHGTPVPGSIQSFEIPLTAEDLTSIMNTILNRAVALGMIPIPGEATIE